MLQDTLSLRIDTLRPEGAESVKEIALRLLDEYDRADAEWVEEVRSKIDAAIAASDRTPPIDGETFVNQILERFGQTHQAQE